MEQQELECLTINKCLLENFEKLRSMVLYDELVNMAVRASYKEFSAGELYEECIVRVSSNSNLSGSSSYVYYNHEGYLIRDVTRYIKFIKNKNKITDRYYAATLIQREFAAQESKGRHTAERLGYKVMKTNAKPTAIARLDKEIDRSLATGHMIRLDEAFPDVGLYESDPNDPQSRTLPTSPAVRARQAAIHGGRYQKEYILRTLHRLTLRRVPLDQIAQMFNVEVETVYGWIDELRARLKSEASTLTITAIAGDTLSFYNEARALGLTIASTAGRVPDKIRGMEVALKAEQDKHKFLQVAGFYDTAKLGRETMEDESSKKARSIINMTKSLLSGRFEEDKEQDIADMIDPSDKVIL